LLSRGAKAGVRLRGTHGTTLTVTKPIFDGLYRREGLLDREPA
jgi:hypothetical protein